MRRSKDASWLVGSHATALQLPHSATMRLARVYTLAALAALLLCATAKEFQVGGAAGWSVPNPESALPGLHVLPNARIS